MTITADTPLWDLESELRRENVRHNGPASEFAVLRVLGATHSPIADHEIHVSIELRPELFSDGVVYTAQRVRSARAKLEDAGLAEVVPGKKVLTPDGGPTRTWRITPKGRAVLAVSA